MLLRRALRTRSAGSGGCGWRWTTTRSRSIAVEADGDARRALTVLEAAAAHVGEGGRVTVEVAREAMQKRFARYDKAGEEHFNLLSAYHKSLRGSDPQGALYWMARMIDGGEDPMTLFRRAIAMAAEDIGLADPNALMMAVAARDAFHMLGPPEGYLPLAEMTIYLATAPKSNSAKVALGRGAGGGAGDAGRAGAAPHPERADRAHEGAGLRRGLPLRPRLAGRIPAAGVPAGRAPRHDASTSRGRSATRRRWPSGWRGGSGGRRREAGRGGGRGGAARAEMRRACDGSRRMVAGDLRLYCRQDERTARAPAHCRRWAPALPFSGRLRRAAGLLQGARPSPRPGRRARRRAHRRARWTWSSGCTTPTSSTCRAPGSGGLRRRGVARGRRASTTRFPGARRATPPSPCRSLQLGRPRRRGASRAGLRRAALHPERPARRSRRRSASTRCPSPARAARR